MSEILSELNPEQRKAAETVKGPLLIIAGAGSGKTRALTHRIAYLIKEKGVDPFNILAVTFTNKAANEMKERIIKLLHPNLELNPEKVAFSGRLDPFIKNPSRYYADLPTIGTFHAVCVQILRRHLHLLDYEDTFNIYDAADSLSLMRKLLDEQNLNEKQFNPKAILAQISNAKNQLVAPKAYEKMVYNYFTEKVASLYHVYQKALAQNQALDFDDILMKTVELFQQHPDVLAEYQERFKYVSVDEYQDTNQAQYIFIKMLADKYRNLCVIGDSDQSIYSWRGANMQNILDFEKDYPDAKVIKLERNYRSTQLILDAAHQIIIKNKKRKDKNLWTDRKEGPRIRLWTSKDEREEAEFVAEEITQKVRQHEKPAYTDFVVLYRTNAQSRVIEEVFLRYGLPYKIVGGVKFYERKEIKDLLAYLRVIQNPNDTVSLLRMINTPPRNIGLKTLEVLQNFALTHNLTLFDAVKNVDKIAELNEGKKEVLQKFYKLWKKLIEANQQFPASGVIKSVIHLSGYKEFILEDGSPEGETRYENIRELVSVANKYDQLEPGMSLLTFLEEVALISDLDRVDNDERSKGERDNAITLMTLHQAKGLEFPAVFIAGLEEGIFPHSRSLFEPEQLEEERRLMYVGITRAEVDLYLLHARQRLLYGEYLTNVPSQFLEDIPEELVEHNDDGFGGLTDQSARLSGSSPRRPQILLQPDQLGKTPVPTEKLDFDELARGAGTPRGPKQTSRLSSSSPAGRSSTSDPGSTRGRGQSPVQNRRPGSGSSHGPGPTRTETFKDGDRIHHKTWGDGVVVNIVGGVITIAFKDPKIGIKKLAVSIAPIEKVRN